MKKIFNEKLFSQIFKFIIVGGLATLMDWLLYYILVNIFNINPLISNIISFTLPAIYNFFASIKWVFNTNENKSKKRMFIEFMIFTVIGLILSELLIFIGINLLKQNKNIIKIFATGIVMIFNFVTRKIFLE